MTRRLLNLLTALSLLLCVAVVALWVRGYAGHDLYIWNRSSSSTFLWTAPGHLRLEYKRALFEDEPNSNLGFRREVRRPAQDWTVVPGTTVRSVGEFAVVTGERWSDYHYALFI